MDSFNFSSLVNNVTTTVQSAVAQAQQINKPNPLATAVPVTPPPTAASPTPSTKSVASPQTPVSTATNAPPQQPQRRVSVKELPREDLLLLIQKMQKKAQSLEAANEQLQEELTSAQAQIAMAQHTTSNVHTVSLDGTTAPAPRENGTDKAPAKDGQCLTCIFQEQWSEELRTKNRLLESRVEELTAAVRQHDDAQLKAAQMECASLRARLAGETDALQSAVDEIKSLSAAVTALTRERDEVKLTAKKQENTTTQSLQEKEAELNDKRSEIEQLRQQRDELLSKQSSSPSHSDKSVDYSVEIQRLNDELDDIRRAHHRSSGALIEEQKRRVDDEHAYHEREQQLNDTIDRLSNEVRSIHETQRKEKRDEEERRRRDEAHKKALDDALRDVSNREEKIKLLQSALDELSLRYSASEQKSNALQARVVAMTADAATVADRYKADLGEAEQKVNQADARLVKSYTLLSAEKKAVEDLNESVHAYQKNLISAQNELNNLVKTNQILLNEKQQTIDALQSQLHDLKQRHVQSDALTEELNEVRRELQSREDALVEVRDELEHERVVRDRERVILESAVELERTDREREREEREREFARLDRERREQMETLEAEINSLNIKLRAGAKKYKQTLTEQSELKSAKETAESRCASLEAEIEQVRNRLSELTSAHDSAVSGIEETFTQQLSALQTEYDIYKQETTAQLRLSAAQLSEATSTIKRLEEEIATGRPSERRLFELAELQARRDDVVRALQAENQLIKAKYNNVKSKFLQLRDENGFLSKQVEQHNRSTSRAQVNVDYLKSIMVRFLQFEHLSAQRKALVPVIATILQFTPDDMKNIASVQRATVWDSVFGSDTSITPISFPSLIPANVQLSPQHANGISTSGGSVKPSPNGTSSAADSTPVRLPTPTVMDSLDDDDDNGSATKPTDLSLGPSPLHSRRLSLNIQHKTPETHRTAFANMTPTSGITGSPTSQQSMQRQSSAPQQATTTITPLTPNDAPLPNSSATQTTANSSSTTASRMSLSRTDLPPRTQ